MENYDNIYEPKKDSILYGAIGAVLGGIVGMILWVLIGVLTHRIFALVGAGVGLLVCWGYDKFKGREGIARIIIVTVCVILAVGLGALGFTVWDMHTGYQEIKQAKEAAFASGSDEEIAAWYFMGEEELYEEYQAAAPIKQKLFIQELKANQDDLLYSEAEMFAMCFEDPEFLDSLRSDGLSSIFFGLLGSFGLISGTRRKKEEQPVVFPADESTNEEENERLPDEEAFDDEIFDDSAGVENDLDMDTDIE